MKYILFPPLIRFREDHLRIIQDGNDNYVLEKGEWYYDHWGERTGSIFLDGSFRWKILGIYNTLAEANYAYECEFQKIQQKIAAKQHKHNSEIVKKVIR